MREWPGLKPGSWKAECSRCGWDYHADEMKQEWTGNYVCKTCWEPRHSQDFVRGVSDDPSVPWTRPAVTLDDGITYVGDTNTTLTSSSDTIQIFNTTLTANRTVTLDTANFKNGDRFQIEKADGTAFTIDVDGLKTLTIDSTAHFEFNGAKWQFLRLYVSPL